MALGNIHPIRPIHVVIAGEDKRYRGIASFLLARRGFNVCSTATPSELLELLERGVIDVVVLDATGSSVAAAETAAALTTLHPDVRVIVATEDGKNSWGGDLRPIAKWRELEKLSDSVELAHIGVSAETAQLKA